MADDIENDDQWLYGDNDNTTETDPPASTNENTTTQECPPESESDETNIADPPPTSSNTSYADMPEVPPGEEPYLNPDTAKENDVPNDAPTETPEENDDQQNGEGSDKEDSDEDSDDDVNVVIGDIKTPPAYSSLNIKRGGLLTTTSKGDKPQLQSGKFTVEEFETAGLINGIQVSEFNFDGLEDKPWRKPGADITDYFNYGFNEDTWRAYCERQKRMRVNESGTGLLPLNSIGMPRPAVLSIMNDNSKYAANYLGLRKAGPPPPRSMTGSIDVIGGTTTNIPGGPLPIKVLQPKENVIQVMTADRREYSRKPPPFPDMSVPPPTFEEFVPEINFNPEPEPFYGGYEPTQDIQWGTDGNPNWQPQEIKTLTPSSPGPAMISPSMPLPSPGSMIPPNVPRGLSPGLERERSPSYRRSRSRERESSRRESERPRDRERSHRRERSRSRSKRHKSRSRSQSRSHRSHRKKKSRRHEDSE